ncbi:MAG: hypothetical protein H6999_12595 [Hahellaceae bacterium]|nr:hypothetical protein [Hahellaceae bacterium]MCP5170582.1 hypothetical protein [Hahellaceae bacterium]
MSLFVMLLIAISALVWVLYSHMRANRLRRVRAVYRLSVVKEMKALFVRTQQHRGLTTGYLNGDHSLQRAIDAARRDINQLWDRIIEMAPELSEDTRYQGAHSHWQRLSSKWPTLTVANNIEQHSRLILNHLYLLEDYFVQNNLVFSLSESLGLRTFLKELLDCMEVIGQVRAIGTGVVALGGSTSVERIRVKFLLEKIESKRRLVRELLIASRLAESGRSFTHELAKSDQAMIALVNLIEKELCKSHHIELDAEAFFTLATTAISPLSELFDAGIALMERTIATYSTSTVMSMDTLGARSSLKNA